MTRKSNKYPPRKGATEPKTVKKKSKEITPNRAVGKIGYCDNITLGITDKYGKPIKGGHYVFVRELDGAGKCNVNIVTSLEDKNERYQIEKLHKVKRGMLYPVPKPDADFTQWSAINLDGNINGVPVSKIKNIGAIKIRKRHKFFVGKFTKRK